MSEIDSIRIVEMPDLGVFTSTSAVVGEHLGSGLFTAAGLGSYFLPLSGGRMTGQLNVNGVPGNNQVYIGPWTETSVTGPYGSDLLIQRNWNIAGGTLGMTPGSLRIQSTVSGTPNLFVWPFSVQMTLATTGASPGQHVGINSTIWRDSGGTPSFAFHGQYIDRTGQVLAGSSAVGCELDIQASGPEAATTSFNPRFGARAFIALSPTAYAPASWQASHAYVVGNVVQPSPANGFTYVCSVAGTSGASPPVWPTAAGTVGDGSAQWQYATTKAMQVSRAIALGGSSEAQFASALFTDNSYFYDAILEFSTAHLADGGVKNAAIRLAANMPIDFSGNGTDAGQNRRTIKFNSSVSALHYTVDGTVMFSVTDSGETMLNGPLNIGGTGFIFNDLPPPYNGQRTAFGWDGSNIVAAVGGTEIGKLHTVGKALSFSPLPTNAVSDAAAAGAGVAVGGVYRNGSALQVRVA